MMIDVCRRERRRNIRERIYWHHALVVWPISQAERISLCHSGLTVSSDEQDMTL